MRTPTSRLVATFTAAAMTATAFTALTSAALAQGDFDFDQTTPATFTGPLQLDYKGAPPSRPMMFMLSLNGGPIPLQLMFGVADPRSIQVGVDLIPVWVLTQSSPSGNGAFNFPVPNVASIQGLPLHVQLMTGGTTTFIDKISNKIVVVPGAAGTADLLAARLGDGRTPKGPGRGLMAVFPITGSKGRYMLAGGGVGNILGAQGLQTTEIFDTRTKTITPGPDMLAARALATATQLKDGRVLMVGGVDALGNPTDTCELYDPTTNSFVATGTMTEKRAGHAAALLNDGRVLVVAGTRELSDVVKAISGILRSAEIYNPTTGTWSKTADISTPVIGPALTTLANGKVLVSGGAMITSLFGIPLSVNSITTCQLFDPANGTWAGTGAMRQSRAVHTLNTIRSLDGRVLVTGGIYVNIGLIPPPTTFAGATAVDNCEYYNPATGGWTALPALSVARSGHSVGQMPNGKVLVAGGAQGAIDAAVSVTSVQEFDPATNSFVRTFNLKAARATHGALIGPSGDLMVFGGTASAAATTTLDSIEIVHQ